MSMLAVPLVLALLASSASAAPVPGSFAYDFRNTPAVGPLLDREIVVLSARGMLAPGRADSLIAAGVRPFVIVQPNQAWRNGGVAIGAGPADDLVFPWDTATYELAVKHDAILRKADGSYLDMYEGDPWSSMVLAFGNREFGRAYAALLVATFPKAAGVLLDYGCPWIPVAVPDWPAWRAGWIAMLEEVRRLRPDLELIAQCDNPVALALQVDGMLFERVGSALNPPARTWATSLELARTGRRPLYRQEWTDSRTRRFFAGAALYFAGAFDQCADPNKVPPVHVRDIEHFALAAGSPAGDGWERSPGVWQRMTTRGLVIVNATGPPLTYRYNATTTFHVQPGDALVLVNRDARGRWIKAITNAGR